MLIWEVATERRIKTRTQPASSLKTNMSCQFHVNSKWLFDGFFCYGNGIVSLLSLFRMVTVLPMFPVDMNRYKIVVFSAATIEKGLFLS